MQTGYFILVGLYFLGLVTRTVYELWKKTGRIDPKNKIIFAIVFAAMCLMWASWFGLCPLDPFRLVVLPAVKWLGFGLFVVGLVLAIGGMIQLRGVENIDHLVTTSLFAKIRHPMYTGFLLWIFGWAIYHGALLSLLFGLAAVGDILFWRALEEKNLLVEYGDVYLAYRKRTWF